MISISTLFLLVAISGGCSKSQNENAPKEITNTAQAAISTVSTTSEPAKTFSGIRYEATPSGNKCTIAGTSTVHDWTMDTKIISGFIEADEKFPESALTDAATAKPKVSVSMPVRSFKSGKSSTMDEKMQTSMDATKFMKIEYRLIELKPKSKAGATGALEFDAVGALTIIGNTVTNTMPVTIEKKGTNIVVIGSAPIKMTDYKMKPPVITLLGIPTMSVGDDLKITFEWHLAKRVK